MAYRWLSWFVLTLTLGAGIVFVTTANATLNGQQSDETEPQTVRAISPGTPERLIIPELGVDAYVEHLGVAASGNMAVPQGFNTVGWYRYGTLPGAVGSAVMDGHVNNALGAGAVFTDIHTLRPGSELYVRTQAGEKLRFLVEEVATYRADAVPRERLFARADVSRLNLITCAGAWDKAKEAYDHRTVVYARLAS